MSRKTTSANPVAPDAPEVSQMREEAECDLEDAVALARTPTGAAMAIWHAAQAAEKFLRCWARTAGRTLPLMSSLSQVFEAIADLPGASDLTDAVARLSGLRNDRAPEQPLRPEAPRDAIDAARVVRRKVLEVFGVEVPPDEPEPTRETTGPEPQAADSGPGDSQGRGPRPRGPALQNARSGSERRTSYVRVFWMCSHCGVRIPRTQQTARGRVPCPMCGRNMILVQ